MLPETPTDTPTILKRAPQPRVGNRNDGADFVEDSAYFEGVSEMIEATAGAPVRERPTTEERPAFCPRTISPDEMTHARLTPDCVVPNLIYADVGLIVAPGGVGKTTLMLWIAAHIVLGRRVFGEAVRKPGPVILVTAEDPREIIVARLREVIAAMSLSDADRTTVLGQVSIADVSGVGYKLTMVDRDVVLPSGNLTEIIYACREIKPVMIVIDPAVSFGVGESRVNDSEQGLVEAARKLRNALNCAVIYVHHSGKANAREKTLDQYTGRGGSAFADGSRMVHVLQNMSPDEWLKATGEPLKVGETGIVLARPKMSYCPPVGDLFIKRVGYAFERVETAPKIAKAAKREAEANQLHQWLTSEIEQGRFHSKNSIEHADAGSMIRSEKRAALAWLEASGKVEVRDRPVAGGRGGARQYLHPIGRQDENADPATTFASPDCLGEAT